jgi:hypothetical protein
MRASRAKAALHFALMLTALAASATASLGACGAFGQASPDASSNVPIAAIPLPGAVDDSGASLETPVDAASSDADPDPGTPNVTRLARVGTIIGMRVLSFVAGPELVITTERNVLRCSLSGPTCTPAPQNPALPGVRYVGAIDDEIYYADQVGALRRLGDSMAFGTAPFDDVADDGEHLLAKRQTSVYNVRAGQALGTAQDTVGFRYANGALIAAQNGCAVTGSPATDTSTYLYFDHGFGKTFEYFGSVSKLTSTKVVSPATVVFLSDGQAYARSSITEMMPLRPDALVDGSVPDASDAAPPDEATAIDVDSSENVFVATYDGTRAKVYRYPFAGPPGVLVASIPRDVGTQSLDHLAVTSDAIYAVSADGWLLRIVR